MHCLQVNRLHPVGVEQWSTEGKANGENGAPLNHTEGEAAQTTDRLKAADSLDASSGWTHYHRMASKSPRGSIHRLCLQRQ